jgi:hypothetical protein
LSGIAPLGSAACLQEFGLKSEHYFQVNVIVKYE